MLGILDVNRYLMLPPFCSIENSSKATYEKHLHYRMDDAMRRHLVEGCISNKTPNAPFPITYMLAPSLISLSFFLIKADIMVSLILRVITPTFTTFFIHLTHVNLLCSFNIILTLRYATTDSTFSAIKPYT